MNLGYPSHLPLLRFVRQHRPSSYLLTTHTLAPTLNLSTSESYSCKNKGERHPSPRIRPTTSASTDEVHIAGGVASRSLPSQLTPLLSAVPQLFIPRDLKSFRFRSYKKTGGCPRAS